MQLNASRIAICFVKLALFTLNALASINVLAAGTSPANPAGQTKETKNGSTAKFFPTDQCIDRLRRGENQFAAKISSRALKNLRRGLEHFSERITDSRRALLVDYSLNSSKKRAYLIDVRSCEVLAHEYVIHGGTVYHPVVQNFASPIDDGMLRSCRRPDGSRKSMTRPGFYLTEGCHQTRENGWTILAGGCQGVKLDGLEATNHEAIATGLVLHEHTSIPDDASIKPVGQGCMAFPPGRLKDLLNHYDIFEGTLVYAYVPQCSRS